MDLVLTTDKFLLDLEKVAGGIRDSISIPNFVREYGGSQFLLRRIAEDQEFEVMADGRVCRPNRRRYGR
jgi:hypothetical protein